MLIYKNSPLMSKWVALLVLVIVLLTASLVGVVRHYSSRVTTLADQAAAKEAELAGANAALLVKPKEVIKVVEKLVPKEVVRLVERKVIVPVASAVIETPTVGTVLPCLADGPDLNVDVSLSGWMFVGVAGNKPSWNGEMGVKLAVPTVERMIKYGLDDSNTTVYISQEITDALASAKEQKPWHRRHLKVACPGFAVVYGMAHGRWDFGPTCGASLVW